MKLRLLISVALMLCFTGGVRAAESIDEAMKRASVEYGQRLKQANDDLIRMRETVAKEKLPLVEAMRAAEDRIVAAEAEIARLETGQERANETRRKLAQEAESLRKNQNYLSTLAHDSLVSFEEGLLPGEKQFLPEKMQALPAAESDLTKPGQAGEAAAFLQEQVSRALGGYQVRGESLVEGDNKLVAGTYVFAGPQAFFRAESSGLAGTVRLREGGQRAIMYPLADWKGTDSTAFFKGELGLFPADASGGKALRLKETKGTVWQHINKGGVVSYAILAVGIFALILIGQKIHDVSRMRVDQPALVRSWIEKALEADQAERERGLRVLGTTTRELMAAGLKHEDEPKELLEERLDAVLLKQRLHFERRLPLMAVIATAAPLMGLLGTVTGMVRTFTLITVFGTGNAGKLASGISEVLVATELGLLVAIPTLVAHGFLSQRIQKNLSLLERYALEFVTAVQARRFKNDREKSLTV